MIPKLKHLQQLYSAIMKLIVSWVFVIFASSCGSYTPDHGHHDPHCRQRIIMTNIHERESQSTTEFKLTERTNH